MGNHSMAKENTTTSNYWEHRKYHRGEDECRKLLYKWIKEGDKVLDVGCGSGWMWENFKKKGIKINYKGVDLTRDFIEGARIDFPEVWWEVQDARDLREVNKSFDVVTLYHVLEHIPYPGWKDAIKEAVRVARKLVIVTIWRGLVEESSDHEMDMYDDIEKYDYLRARIANYIGKDELFDLFKELEFEDIPHHRCHDGVNPTDIFLLWLK